MLKEEVLEHLGGFVIFLHVEKEETQKSQLVGVQVEVLIEVVFDIPIHLVELFSEEVSEVVELLRKDEQNENVGYLLGNTAQRVQPSSHREPAAVVLVFCQKLLQLVQKPDREESLSLHGFFELVKLPEAIAGQSRVPRGFSKPFEASVVCLVSQQEFDSLFDVFNNLFYQSLDFFRLRKGSEQLEGQDKGEESHTRLFEAASWDLVEFLDRVENELD